VDTEVLIQIAEGRTLQEIVDTDGYLELRAIEERLLLGLNVRDHVIATGGSAAYSAAAMAHLKRDGLAVFLHAAQEELLRRVKDYGTRGLARRPDQTFEDLYRERYVLYVRHADVTIDCHGKTQEQIAEEIKTCYNGG
jgi:shikimate kinase